LDYANFVIIINKFNIAKTIFAKIKLKQLIIIKNQAFFVKLLEEDNINAIKEDNSIKILTKYNKKAL